jgi:O-antigen/teichoic acid export membrane protein
MENDPGGMNSRWNKILAHFHSLYRSTVIQNIAVFSGASFFAQGLMAVNTIIIARILAPEAYGLFLGTYAAVGLSAIFVNWGLDTWILRYGRTGLDPKVLAGRVLSIKILMGVIWGAILFFLLPLIRPSIFLEPMVLIITIDVLLDSLFNAELSALNTEKRVSTVSALLLTSRGGRLLGTLCLVVLNFSTPVSFALARLITTGCALGFASWALRPKFISKPFNPVLLLRQSMPFALSDLLATVYLQADVTLLALIVGDRKAVGLYGSAEGIINAFFAIPAAAYQISLLALLRLDGQDIHSIRNAIIKMFGGFFGLGVVLWIGLWGGGRFLIQLLLGSAFQPTGELLSILSPILLFKSLSFACAALIVAAGRQHYRVIAQIISASVNIFLNIILIKTFGIRGVAGVYVVSEFILVLAYLWIVYRWYAKIRVNRVVKWN